MNPRTVLVTGATGRIGGAIARDLIARGHRVRGLTRNTSSPKSERLTRLGAEMVRGTYEDWAAMERALRGVESVVAVGAELGSKLECRQGMSLIDAAAESGVTHYVLVSAAGADRAVHVPEFESKAFVESYLLASTLPYTIIGPAFLMENLLVGDLLAGLQNGKWQLPLPANRRLQTSAVIDVGTFAALVIERRDPFLSKRFDVASDELTPAEASRVLSRVTRHPIEYEALAPERPADGASPRLFAWLDEYGCVADIASLRREYPQVGWHTFESWANTHDWSVLDLQPVARAG